ncbi:nucleotidyltransferase family protein [Rhodococcus qingshengii]|uniref:nucleotidyltransferase family protein n=1 Tax=Rhodococcus TaxID=1827 RepID=UPI001AEF5F97|nr:MULTISPECIES: nucleotidyltransferase family protein [Rhodococcus]MDF3317478.1 nucleotidyltransferase family protein [Rhodococcus sp. C3V]MDJ0486981.1 nucleotidyltransferase family protein [Rhodococcus qingshengii]QTR97863.1 nucleotidyltransferase family protein [Rhodococcus qingshengii]
MRDTRYLISMLKPECGADVIRLCTQQDWPRVIDAAVRHKVLPLLASRAVEAGFASVLPASFAEMLSESSATASSPELTLSLVHHRNTIRISDLDAQRVELQELLHSNGFPTVALKGAALLERKIWPNPAARRMTDIDLLVVDPAHAVPANDAILDFGYRMVRPDEVDSDSIDHDDHQEPALLRDDRHGSVEIHSHLLPRFARHALTREAAVRGISAEAEESRLAMADVTLHVIAHARLADRALIRADLSLNSVFDVGYLLTSEPELAVTLSRRQLPRDVRRAVNVHWAAVESIFGVSTGMTTISARWWWRWTLWLADRPRLHSLYRDLVMVPLFLDRDRLSIRDGRDLRGWDLARSRVSHFVRRAKTAVEDAGGAA